MFTIKKLAICWALLGAVAVMGATVFDAALKEVAATVEKESPPYVAVSDAEAVRLDFERCTHYGEFELELIRRRSSCEEFFSQPIEQIAEVSQNHHRQAYYRDVDYRVNTRDSELRTRRETFFVGLLIVAGVALLLWFISSVMPRFVAAGKAVRQRAPSFSDLKAMGENRKVRKAESEFATLKNLYENGLISQEMFEKRKDELKAALSSNRMFHE